MTGKLKWTTRVSVMLLAGSGVAWAECAIQQQRPLDDMDGGVTGYCSNNGQPVTCRYTPGEGWACEGPQGTYTAVNNRQGLIGQACGCSIQDENE